MPHHTTTSCCMLKAANHSPVHMMARTYLGPHMSPNSTFTRLRMVFINIDTTLPHAPHASHDTHGGTGPPTSGQNVGARPQDSSKYLRVEAARDTKPKLDLERTVSCGKSGRNHTEAADRFHGPKFVPSLRFVGREQHWRIGEERSKEVALIYTGFCCPE